MKISEHANIGHLVAENYQFAYVFKSAGIDFCCNGNRTIADACKNTSINVKGLLEELETVDKDMPLENINYQSWPIDLLCDYIEKKHHRYVAQKVDEIMPYLEKIVQVHGKKHPELQTIQKLFQLAAGDLTVHMKKEELLLFPYIRKLYQAVMQKKELEHFAFETVENPVRMMMEEHSTEGERFRKIAELSHNYTAPSDACNTYRVTYALLKEFEEDLHQHIHIENNILFPRAIQWERIRNRSLNERSE